MRTSIQWEDLDYLEGTRLIALNRSAEYCRSHGKLRGILPVRRKQAGTCISCEDLSVYKSDKKSNKNEVNDNLL